VDADGRAVEAGDADCGAAEAGAGLAEPGSPAVSAAAEPAPNSIAAPMPAMTAEEPTHIRDEPMMANPSIGWSVAIGRAACLKATFQQRLQEDSEW
jgi:hypothetical protein